MWQKRIVVQLKIRDSYEREPYKVYQVLWNSVKSDKRILWLYPPCEENLGYSRYAKETWVIVAMQTSVVRLMQHYSALLLGYELLINL